MPTRSRDMSYKRYGVIWDAIDLRQTVRLDFPILYHEMFVAQTECINTEVLKLIHDTLSCIRVRDPSLGETMYFLNAYSKTKVIYDIHIIRDEQGKRYEKLINEFGAEDLPEDAKWADLLSICK